MLGTSVGAGVGAGVGVGAGAEFWLPPGVPAASAAVAGGAASAGVGSPALLGPPSKTDWRNPSIRSCSDGSDELVAGLAAAGGTARAAELAGAAFSASFAAAGPATVKRGPLSPAGGGKPDGALEGPPALLGSESMGGSSGKLVRAMREVGGAALPAG
jgi:hypothetical protein